ncbi:MAG: hypothetical protein A2831_01070 [Candidatus Yanofskybacteria bacterium RIFCSPHIGHO2_01_FULL_44_17]|uniref:Uncharacterized protein n=1 Tax=Candidatus Yanofskybacteria bacterium RIFCSPHIGHO2_01_FULL_44_17 TaxID=1802668 RepID=A0A1F8EVS6_9BACT|nr:MAG: hypothetical protein A2831_01070 [Candidatus Yanofskybacteria bacterium RIFCSPHIGHO2_01_FULL_44_17]
MKLREKQISALVVLAAVIIGGVLFFSGALGWLFPILNQKATPELPADFPSELLVNEMDSLVAASTVNNFTSAVFLSKDEPNYILEKIIASLEFGGWEIINQSRDSLPLYLFANLRVSATELRTVEFRILKTADSTQVQVGYGRQ